MTWRDIPRLADLELELFAADAWSEATWWAELAGRPRREYVVLVDGDGELAGYAGLDHGGDVADVMTVAVVPAWRGAGLGRRLVGELLTRAASRGAEAVMLEVRADNVSALRLYAGHGFEQVAVRRGYYPSTGMPGPGPAGPSGPPGQPGPGSTDALVLRRVLTAPSKAQEAQETREQRGEQR